MNNEASQPEKVYFKNLNGVRFIAAFVVIIHHIEQIKNTLGIANYWKNKTIFLIGQLGVVLFFALSGFLITFLLCKEQTITRTINVKYFYIRRILRIWPLYFLLVLICFFLLPHISVFNLSTVCNEFVSNHFDIKLVMFVLFLPNLALATFTPIPFLSHTWSIGVEEQFYLIWPFLIKFGKHKLLLIIAFIVLCLGCRYILPIILPVGKYVKVFNGYMNWMPVSCMAIGAMFGLLPGNKKKFATVFKAILFKPLVQIFIMLLLCLLIGWGISFNYCNQEIYALFFGVIIINLACNKQSILNLENPILSYLGKISYGLYMFHPIVIFISIKILQLNNMMENITLYMLSFISTIIIAGLSYQFFEKPFIYIKINYSKIISGDNAIKK